MTPEYEAAVKAAAASIPPLDASQADLCSRILLPEGFHFVADAAQGVAA